MSSELAVRDNVVVLCGKDKYLFTNIGLILILAGITRISVKPFIPGILYFLIHLGMGLSNGSSVGIQLVQSIIFSVFPLITFMMVYRYRTSTFAWILLSVGAAVANDFLIMGLESLEKMVVK